MNPLFNLLGGNNMLQRFQQFRNSFRGDPREQVQRMLNSGQITQAQYDNAVRMANEFMKTFSPGGQR